MRVLVLLVLATFPQVLARQEQLVELLGRGRLCARDVQRHAEHVRRGHDAELRHGPLAQRDGVNNTMAALWIVREM